MFDFYISPNIYVYVWILYKRVPEWLYISSVNVKLSLY
jgi:hypothetical protein